MSMRDIIGISLGRLLCAMLILPSSLMQAAELCSVVFPGGVQSHSATGFIDLGYQSRIYGGGDTLIAPRVTQADEWYYLEQNPLCDGARCKASGTHAGTSSPEFKTESKVPSEFKTGTASDGDVSNGYNSGTLVKPVGDYGTVTVGQGSVIRFSSGGVGGTYYMKEVKTSYQSALELEAGDYWINGNLDLTAGGSVLRRVGSASGPVRLYVSGNVNAAQLQFSGFSDGQFELYVTGNVNFTNWAQVRVPGAIHAAGAVSLGQYAEVSGGVYSSALSTGNSVLISYLGDGGERSMGTLTAAYQSVYEFGPGDYYIDGNLTANVESVFRKVSGAGKVRLFVRGNIDIEYAASFQDFAGGELLMYATGDVKINSQRDLPAFVYAAGDVRINFSSGSRYQGGITGRNIYIGQGSIVEYLDPVDLGSLCDPEPVQTCFTDDFNSSALNSSDWAVTSRSGSFGAPRIVGGRLRLTDNSNKVATGATLQRLLPAAGNIVQVEFRYYAHSGSWNPADGMAVILSDAAITPQPGGYGGSLGYAQKYDGVLTSGFAGGWLGVGLDEYGNFSRASENRVGGPGQRKNAIAIRGAGSGTTGYAYLAGTAANRISSGDIYRITIDSTVIGKAKVKVERKSGSGYVALISEFDVLSHSSQTALPENFYLSFTGSTGDSTNIHELDDVTVCAYKWGEVEQLIDHFEIVSPAQGLTCNPLDITVRACLDAACNRFTDPVTANATLSVGSSIVGSQTKGFTGGEGVFQLRKTTAGTAVLGINGSSPSVKPLSQTLCRIGTGNLGSNCQVEFLDSGFVLDVPNMVAAKPVQAYIRAVRKSDESEQCVPGFADVARVVSFTSAYHTPTSGTQAVVVNDQSVKSDPVQQNLIFDSNGSALLEVRYDDAGKMTLNASYTGSVENGDSGLLMTGTTDFVSKPYGLYLETDSSCSEAAVSKGCVLFKKAGENFPLRITAVAWEKDGESLTAADLANNAPTPNFALAGISLATRLVAPDGGEAAEVSPGTYDHVLGDLTVASVSLSEVGIFEIEATPGAGGYLDGETVSGGTSALVGRIIPAYLHVSGTGSLVDNCSGTAYQGQDVPYEFDLYVAGRNSAGGVTRNYRLGDFFRLPQRDPEWQRKDNVAIAQGRLSTTLASRTWAHEGATSSGASNGRWLMWRDGRVNYSRSVSPDATDIPFRYRHFFSETVLTDDDGICMGATDCQGLTANLDSGGTVHLGRVISENINVPVGNAGIIPLRLEHWGANGWQPATDTCSTLLAPTPATDELVYSSPITNATVNAAAWNRTSLGITVQPAAPYGSVLLKHLLTGPNAGAANQPAIWLCQSRSGVEAPLGGVCSYTNAAGPAEIRSSASFGVYRGPERLIFRREVYR
ncbi:DUF6701 domain-containing protein [Stutzerimonas kirkiae]|uniref:DUF6701 domain-containing protein n=1 Tax=Stutzerimonas kirkiae TaxID=2211392 RepID=UPI00103857D9|nr:DUF6701 domain-containing protein [Stutzerimonas kirkiae]TBV17469.1 hypothetical protein DNK01_01025 [Stutzerimonas kirkiae]